MRQSNLLAFFVLSLDLAVGSTPAVALVIEPVSLTRTVSASASVTDPVSGMQDVDPGQTISSTNPSLTFSISTNASASLLGWSAGSSASSWTVSFSDLPAGDHIVNLAADTSATLNANP